MRATLREVRIWQQKSKDSASKGKGGCAFAEALYCQPQWCDSVENCSRIGRMIAVRKLLRCTLVSAAMLVPASGLANASEVEGPGSKSEILAAGESMRISEDHWESIQTGLPGEEVNSGLPTGPTSSNTPAPACVNAVVEWGFVQVYNNCGFDVRVKVVMALGLDSPCSLVVNGTRHNISPAAGRIDRVEMC